MGKLTYLLQQPQALESMALKKLVEWIASHAEKLAPSIRMLLQTHPINAQELLSRQIGIIRNYVECRLPGRFHNEAMVELQHAVCRLRIIADVRRGDILKTMLGSVIEALFTKYITSLKFSRYEWELHRESFYSKPHLISGLNNLTLNSVCTDDVLRLVEEKFKFVETLDLSQSVISDDCIDTLIKLSNLRSVNFSKTRLSVTGIEKLLMSCPNIEHVVTDVLSGTPNFDIAQVVVNIVYLDEHEERRFNLKSYENNPKATFEEHQLLVKTCPLIEKLDLVIDDDYDNPENDYLNPFQSLINLRELSLGRCCFYTHRVKELLQARGSHLEYIRFCEIGELDFSALKHIYVLCPNLQDLDLRSCPLYEDPTFWENDKIPCKETISPLKYLKRISVTGFRSWRPEEHLVFLLSYCPNVEYIDINGRINSLDNIILSVLDKNCENLMCLKELKFRGQLSKSVMDRIAQNCVHPLEVIRRWNPFECVENWTSGEIIAIDTHNWT